MAKVYETVVKKDTLEYAYCVLDVGSDFICFDAVKSVLKGRLPKYLHIKIYDNDPKRKGTLKVTRSIQTHVDFEDYFYNWKNEHTDAYSEMNEALCKRKTSWIVIEPVKGLKNAQAIADKLNIGN